MNFKLRKTLVSFLLLIALCFCFPQQSAMAIELEIPNDIHYTIDITTGYVSCQFTALSDNVMYSLEVSDTKDGTYQAVDYWQYCSIGTDYTLRDKYTIRGNQYWYRVEIWAASKTPIYTEPTQISIPMLSPNIAKELCESYSTCNKIIWNDVRFAKEYIIYRSTKQNGTYKRIGTTQTTFYYDDSVKPKTTYYYKLAAVSSQEIESEKSNSIKLKTPKAKATSSTKKTIPNFTSYSGIQGKRITNQFNGIKQVKIIYQNVSSAMYYGYRELLLQKKYQLNTLCCGDSVSCFDYTGKANIVHGISGLGDDASYRTVADLYLKYNSKAKQLTIYLSPSFTLSKVAKSEQYKKSDESMYSTSKDFDSKTMKSCSHCLGTGKVDCPKCHGTGKLSKYVYNTTTHVNDSIEVSCPMCMNGHESCIYCNGRGWNYK